MKSSWLIILTIFVACMISITQLGAQDESMREQYIGILPSVLLEPYDKVDAIEINTIPIVYERRWGTQNQWGIQARTILNYRILEAQSGISQMGGTLLVKRYLFGLLDGDFWLVPQLGSYFTYAYNRLDKIRAMTGGLEIGACMKIARRVTMNCNLQPGINYYPDDFSREFVQSDSGYKPHFGVIIHLGYNF